MSVRLKQLYIITELEEQENSWSIYQHIAKTYVLVK